MVKKSKVVQIEIRDGQTVVDTITNTDPKPEVFCQHYNYIMGTTRTAIIKAA